MKPSITSHPSWRRGALTAGLAALASSGRADDPALKPLGSYTPAPNSSEIVVFDKFSRQLYTQFADGDTAGVAIVDAADPANLATVGTVDLSTIDGVAARNISSVAADPLGRGFGVATFIPRDSGSEAGKLVFFDPVARTVLHSVDVGFHPDSVRFSADGTKLFVANEGEPVSEGDAPFTHFDRPGSISVVDLADVAAAADVAGLGPAQVGTYDFSAANLGPGVDPALPGLRVNPSNAAPASRFNDVEPEHITQRGDKLLVSLQENNAVAEFDLAQGKWTRIDSLGTIEQRIDASDRDGGIHIDDQVHGLPMPDALASYSVGGNHYYITANEGDTRPPDFVEDGHPLVGDDPRVAQLGSDGRPPLDPDYDAALDAAYDGDAQDNAALGRLRVSLTDGDLDNDGDIDRLTMFGTRSFTIWDAETGMLVWDSGSAFEEFTAAEVPTLFNSNGDPGSFDGRSPNKGPEPEGLTLGEVFGRTWAFIALERTGGVVAYDITDPLDPRFVQYINTGELGPEGLEFVPAWDSPNGLPLLFVGFEVSSQIGAFALVPEAGTVLPAAGLAGLIGLWCLRRHHRSASLRPA